MAHIFSDENGNIGTIIVLKGHPTNYLPETHTYHGDHAMPVDAVREALEFNNGVLEESLSKLKEIKIREVNERHANIREDLKNALHEALLDNKDPNDIASLRADAVQLTKNKDTLITYINSKLKVSTVKAVDHLSFTHEV